MQRETAATLDELEMLKRIWAERSVIPDGARWSLMTGGRSNQIWRVQSSGQPDLVCKLFKSEAATPLFANDGTRETMALRALQGTGLAPELVAFQDSILGESLIYRHVEGQTWSGEIDALAHLMAQLHARAAPEGLPNTTTTPDTLRADGAQIAQEVQAELPLPPSAGDIPSARHAFLHGDIVPGNIIVSSDGLRLIDWQCPAIGDPCADIAVFLSPAMHKIYGHAPLSAAQVDQFLNAYEAESGHGDVVARYCALAPLFHWRMAAYCLWKGARGDQDYTDAAPLELAALEQR